MGNADPLVEALYTPEFMKDPFPAWQSLRREAPVTWDERSNVWLVMKYEDVGAVLADHGTYSTQPYEGIFRPVIGETMVEMDGPEHDELRTIVSPALVGGKLAKLQDTVQARVTHLLAKLPNEGEIDLIERVTSQLPVMVMTDLLGLPPEDHDYLVSVTAKIMHALPGQEPALSEGVKAFIAFSDHIAELVTQRAENPGEDLISSIVTAESESGRRLTSEEVASFIALLLVAGSETTDRALANFWYLLMSQPDVMRAIANDGNLIEAAITEFMRFDGVVVYEDRRTTKAVNIRGIDIPPDAIVRVGLMSANNDETVFAEPRDFRLLRSDLRQGKENRAGGGKPGVQPHLGFGIGKHFCIGYQLARLEMTCATKLALPLLMEASFIDDREPVMEVDWFHRHLDRFPVVIG